MRNKYSCTLRFTSKPEYFRDTFAKVIDNLIYTPHSVYCFFNEFKRPPDKQIPFERQYLLENLSTQEMIGITSMSIYDSQHSSTNVTPFIRIRFNVSKNIENSSVTIEWVAFSNLDFLIINDQVILQYLSDNNILNFCYICNQTDTSEQSYKPETWIKKNYGKRITHMGIEFQAAPIMYFGKAFDSIIPFSKLLKTERKFLINDEVIKIELGNLYCEPVTYRKEQKKYWKSINMDNIIKKFIKKNKIDFFQEIERRYELSKNKIK